MSIKNDFELREVCGEYILLAYGKENIDFTKVISMNDPAAMVWRKMEGKDFDVEYMTAVLVDESDVDTETAKAYSDVLLQRWINEGLLQ